MKSEKDAEQTETESQGEPDPVIQEDNENEEADISYEEINDETIAFIQLLESFKVSIEVINKFLANGYDVESLKVIERREIEELLCEPFLGDRTKIIHGLNVWRKSQNLQPVSSPLKLVQNLPQPKDQPETKQREMFSAKFLINKSAKGKQILETYKLSRILTKSQKRMITHIVIDEFKDVFGKLTHIELLSRADELGDLFPTESKESWYQPTFALVAGKKTRLGHLPKGCLYDRNCNYTALQASQQKSNDSENITPPCSPYDADWVEYQQAKTWIRHHEDEWPAVMQKWASTSVIRLYEISKLDKPTCELVLDLFPTLRKPEGYQLGRIDFDTKFPTKSAALFAKWNVLISSLKPIFVADVTDKAGKAILSLLERDLNEDCRDVAYSMLLPYILPCSVLTLLNKSKWKPSYIENRNSFVFWVQNITDLQSKVKAHHISRSENRGMLPCPLVVVVGPELTQLNTFIISFGDAFYRLPTFLKALDVCYKLHKVYNLPFAKECAGSWNLINHVIYDFPLENSCRAKILSIINVINTGS
ncbi:uncharacterized protein LOC109402257 [Aedes albopictus]|uniref:SAM domain-containing protein n=1 Tax=Aedes albopictus TaxID=7160 RepID=A0ABM1YZ50_AEDAL|nr:uncharacterized protein LOC115265435 [Aedes albopictus]